MLNYCNWWTCRCVSPDVLVENILVKNTSKSYVAKRKLLRNPTKFHYTSQFCKRLSPIRISLISLYINHVKKSIIVTNCSQNLIFLEWAPTILWKLKKLWGRLNSSGGCSARSSPPPGGYATSTGCPPDKLTMRSLNHQYLRYYLCILLFW